MIHNGEIDLVSGHTAFHLINIAEILLVGFGMELTPCGGRAGQINHGSHFDVFGPYPRAHAEANESYGDHQNNHETK